MELLRGRTEVRQRMQSVALATALLLFGLAPIDAAEPLRSQIDRLISLATWSATDVGSNART